MEKGTVLGSGLSATPEGPATLPPWSPCLAIIWALEKYRWPWLTELFFRFEPAPPFDSDPAGEGKQRFPKAPRVVWAARSCQVFLSCQAREPASQAEVPRHWVPGGGWVDLACA